MFSVFMLPVFCFQSLTCNVCSKLSKCKCQNSSKTQYIGEKFQIQAIGENGDVKLRPVQGDGSLQKKIINCPFAKFTEKYQLLKQNEILLEHWPACDIAKCVSAKIFEAENVAKIAMLEMYKSIPQPMIKITLTPHKGVFVTARYPKHGLVLPMYGDVSTSKGSVPILRFNAHVIQNLTIEDHVFYIRLSQTHPEQGCVPASFVRHTPDEAQVNLDIVWKSAYSHKTKSKTLTPKIPCFVNTCPLNVGDEVKFHWLKDDDAKKGIKRAVQCVALPEEAKKKHKDLIE